MGCRWTGSGLPLDQDRCVDERTGIRQIDRKAMQLDPFNTMKGRPTRLIGRPGVR